MPPSASHVEVESYLTLADVLRPKRRKHNTVKLKMKVPVEAVEDLPEWSKKDMSQYIAFVENLHSADLYATARLDAASMRPDGYKGNEQGILQSIFESWNLTTHYTQFWIRIWERLHAEAVTYWARRNAQLQQQADKATAVDDGLLDPDGDLDLSRVTRPNNVTFNGSGETTEADLGEGVVVKVPIDKDGQVEGADQFRNKNRFLPMKVLAIRKATYETSRNGLNMPKKSWLAGKFPDDFEKRENIAHDSILRNFTVAQMGLHQEIWDYLTTTSAHHNDTTKQLAGVRVLTP